MSERILLTGFPSNELACRVLLELLADGTGARITCLTPARFRDAAEGWLSARSDLPTRRVELLEGDVAAIDLGLSGTEFLELAASVTLVHHCAAVTYSGAPSEMAERVNVGGTHEVLELGRNAKRLTHVVHWSTLSATGAEQGVVREDVLLEPSSKGLLRTRYRAERLMARATHELPITVLRHAPLVGDTRDGALRRLEGLHLLIAGVLGAPRELPLPLLGARKATVQVVPIDYAARAGMMLARARDSIGRTFHIVDTAPPTLEQTVSALCDLLDRPAPRGEVPTALGRLVLGLPGVSKLAHAQRALLEEVGSELRCDDRNARAVLTRAGLSCPPLLTQLPRLVQHVAERAGSASGLAFTAPSP